MEITLVIRRREKGAPEKAGNRNKVKGEAMLNSPLQEDAKDVQNCRPGIDTSRCDGTSG